MEQSRLWKTTRKVGRFALDLVLPPTCAICGTEIDQPRALCATCFGRLHPIGQPRCDQCGVPLPSAAHLGADARCVSCELHPPPWSHGRAAYVYDEGSRDLILALKYADRTENAAFLARQMARAADDILSKADWLIPVPVHWRRLLERKYNQAALLARAVERLTHLPVLVDALQRPRATGRLAQFSATARAQEMKDAITVRGSRVAALKDRHIVLVDDILTTGATATACTQVLLAHGVASVSLLAAARTQPDPQEDVSRPESMR
ncbi:ComF family protein [Acetobacter estunensis]|uniref:ComF family protein n=1 Tax=Acetobacter estunensis TaxID=104097 RepID=UPI001C2CD340|nr:ComF family protein [Acetobacter estunensis]MBV1836381.1 ComF family protein [Acetobacter estunensis]